MKKKLLFATIILVLLAGILYYISLPDYLVFNSMSFSNGANRDTELQVIVYQYWNTDEVVAEIEPAEAEKAEPDRKMQRKSGHSSAYKRHKERRR